MRFLEETVERLPEGTDADPQQTIGVERVLQRAAFHALSSEQKVMDSADVLVAIYREDAAQALFFLKEEKITRLDVLNFISHGIRKEGAEESDDAREAPTNPGMADEDEPGGPAKNPLEAYTTNLNEQAAEGNIDPLIGRATELERTIQVLCRRRKNNPLYVGETGVGKTAIAEGLALAIFEKKVPDALANAVIFSLDMGSLLAGTKFRGQFEERLKAVLKALATHDDAILFIDENSHHRRRRGDQRRLDGRLEPAQASARQRQAALHRLDHLPGIQGQLRTRPRTVAPLSEDRRA